MRLVDLSPRLVHPHILAFKCPHCLDAWLTVKDVPMAISEQVDAWIAAWGTTTGTVVPCKPETCWSIGGDLATLTVSPSLDARSSGHWHGYIKNGEIC